MRIDLPCCGFKNCRYCFDGNCTKPSEQEKCEYWYILHEESEVIRCKDCKWWRQQTNYQGSPLSFGFCESDDMWWSLYGETYEVSHIVTDDDFYCGYADMRGEKND